MILSLGKQAREICPPAAPRGGKRLTAPHAGASGSSRRGKRAFKAPPPRGGGVGERGRGIAPWRIRTWHQPGFLRLGLDALYAAPAVPVIAR